MEQQLPGLADDVDQQELPDASDVTRSVVGEVGVDSGTMCFADVDSFADVDHYWNERARVTEHTFASESGIGDGGYSVVAVRDQAGALLGIEVVFICPTADAAFAAALAEAGLPGFTWGSASQSERDRYWDQQERFNAVADAAMLTAPAADGSDAVLVGTISVPSGVLAVGDPCYGTPTFESRVPTGQLDAYIYQGELPVFGKRVFRAGVYRRGFVPAIGTPRRAADIAPPR